MGVKHLEYPMLGDLLDSTTHFLKGEKKRLFLDHGMEQYSCHSINGEYKVTAVKSWKKMSVTQTGMIYPISS